MDINTLLTKGVAFVLASIWSIVSSILARDVCQSADSICTKIIRRAVLRLADFQRTAQEAEWLAHLKERDTVAEKYCHAIGCFLAAPEMHRQAKTIVMSVELGIRGFDTIALDFKVGWSTNLFFAISKFIASVSDKSKSRRLLHVWVFCVVVYLFIKLLRRARPANSTELVRLSDELKRIHTWKYQLFVKRNGERFDVAKLITLLGERGAGDVQKLIDHFSKIGKSYEKAVELAARVK